MDHIRRVILICVLVFGVTIQAVPIENDIEDNNDIKLPTATSIAKCAENGGVAGIVNCAAMRALKSIQMMSKLPVIEILPGVTFNSDSETIQRIGKEIAAENAPANLQKETLDFMDLLLKNAARLMSGRTLKIKLPEESRENFSRALVEGRGKMKKMMMPFIMGLGAKMVTIIPIAIGGVALLTTKALLVAKLALVVSGIVFVMMIVQGGLFRNLGNFAGGTTNSIGHDYVYPTYNPNPNPTYGVPTNTLGGPYRRSIDVATTEEISRQYKTAQDLAYWQQKQN